MTCASHSPVMQCRRDEFSPSIRICPAHGEWFRDCLLAVCPGCLDERSMGVPVAAIRALRDAAVLRDSRSAPWSPYFATAVLVFASALIGCMKDARDPCRSPDSDAYVACKYFDGAPVLCTWDDEAEQSTCEGPGERRYVCSYEHRAWSCLEVRP